METQKRLKSAWIVLGLNMGLFAFGIYKGIDLTNLGTGLALMNAPVLVYLLGETFRPSIKNKKDV